MADSPTLREYLAANMFDGDESGVTTMQTSVLLGEVVANVMHWLIDVTATDGYLASYYEHNDRVGLPDVGRR